MKLTIILLLHIIAFSAQLTLPSPSTTNLTDRRVTCIKKATALIPIPPVPSSCENLAYRIGLLHGAKIQQVFASATKAPVHPLPFPVPYCWTNILCQITLDFHAPQNADISSLAEIAIQTHLVTVACFDDALEGLNSAGLAEVGRFGVLLATVSTPKEVPGTECIYLSEHAEEGKGGGGNGNETLIVN
ncbi:uncharacterized protein KY384_002808 [Bacidia gigantensis]|uniref:uncharacterized protein n=1 Tax=Bacidia gigantensis TaxID=2732470 RepID=UPI001D058051|nr:uncharacterized protein KY384_002808 [Bacidia gigantensis]KAG8532930.1 hypothetical protein KY384_002808 [Bacidia gigantensis]